MSVIEVFGRGDKAVSDALLDLWAEAEQLGDDETVAAVKRSLSWLGLPWVRISVPGGGS